MSSGFSSKECGQAGEALGDFFQRGQKMLGFPEEA